MKTISCNHKHKKIICGDFVCCLNCGRVSFAGSEFKEPTTIKRGSVWKFKTGVSVAIDIVEAED